jgi:hypothetical protein
MTRRSFVSTGAAALAIGGVILGRSTWNAAAEPENTRAVKLATAAPAPFMPVPLPDPKIPGFKFPEDEATIIGWTRAGDQKSINLHGWGLWTALNMPSGQTYNGQPLSVFEPWLTPDDLLTAEVTKNRQMSTLLRVPRPLHVLRQFQHLSRGAKEPATGGNAQVTGFVKYDPTGADHIASNGLFKKPTLDRFLASGQSQVPAFPKTALA